MRRVRGCLTTSVLIGVLISLGLSGCGGGDPLYRNIVKSLGITPPPLPAPGATIANRTLQEDVLNVLLARDGVNKACKTYGLKTTELTEPPAGAGQKWKEAWTLDRCG